MRGGGEGDGDTPGMRHLQAMEHHEPEVRQASWSARVYLLDYSDQLVYWWARLLASDVLWLSYSLR